MVSYVVSEHPNKKIRSLISAMINAADNTNLAAKLTITKEEVSIASSTTCVEAAFLEALKASKIYSTKGMP